MNINGTETGETLAGTETNDAILGLGGDDQLLGRGGADLLEGGIGADTLDGGAGGDTLYGENSQGGNFGSYDDLLLGGAGDDLLYGGEGNDTLDGGAGTDRLDGGFGLDTVLYGANTTPLVVNLATGIVSFTGQSWSSETLAGIEGVVAGSGADSLIGGAEANFLSGGLGNDTLRGGEGADTLIGGGGRDRIDGGAGSDMAVYAENTTPLRANLGTGVLTFVGQSWPAETLTSIENLTTGSGDDTVTGAGDANTILTGAGRDSLTGGGGADYLDGGAGADTMAGGSGNDIYVVDQASDRVSESGGASGGVDTVHSSLRFFTLGANFENLTVSGEGVSGTGNALANLLVGDDQSGDLTGAAGDDSLIGGLGDDALHGGAGDDLLAGGQYVLPHGAVLNPFDTPIPFDGRDRIDGGDGTDTLVYAHYYDETEDPAPAQSDPAVTVNLAGGYARTFGFTSQDTLVSIENVVTANGDDIVIGNSAANEISVRDGFNTVDGGGGDDILHGGGGVHFPEYIGDADYVYTLEDTMETLRGGTGDDVIESGGSIVYYDAFHAWWQVRATDVMLGGGGADRLVAGDGAVEVTGGTGADRFEFSTHLWEQSDYGEWYVSYAQTGTVTDFTRSQGDKILIAGAAGARFVGETTTAEVFELAYHRVADDTVVELRLGDQDFNDDGGANETLRITLAGYSGALTADDFLLT